MALLLKVTLSFKPYRSQSFKSFFIRHTSSPKSDESGNKSAIPSPFNTKNLKVQRYQREKKPSVPSLSKIKNPDNSRHQPNTRRPNQFYDYGVVKVWRASESLKRMEIAEHNTGLELIFWGTGSGNPSSIRKSTAMSLKAEGRNWLFDAGECTQMQMKSGSSTAWVALSKLHAIFITHLHGDHVFGLPGILRGLDKVWENEPYEDQPALLVFGPPGLTNLITANLKLTGCSPKRQVIVTEMTNEEIVKHTPNFITNSKNMYQMWKVDCKELRPDQDGFWTLLNDGSFSVRAGLINHTRGMKCFGYVVTEADKEGNIDPKKATAMGLPPGPGYKLLKQGQDVMSDSGVLIKSSEVVGPKLPGRKVTILGDTYDASNILELAKGSDLVVHESTLTNDLEKKAVAQGHSTPRIAAEFANKAQASSLALTHFSPRYHCYVGDGGAGRFVKEAEKTYKGPVIAANDFMTIQIQQKRGEHIES